jgi:dihydropteroate synthase
LAAVVDRWGIAEAAVMAVQAGADIVMEIGPTEVSLIALQGQARVDWCELHRQARGRPWAC